MDRNQLYYDGYFVKRTSYRHFYKLAARLGIILLIAYILTCLFLYFRQDYIIYKANQHISASYPSDRNFQLNYQNVWIDVPKSKARIHSWWFDAPRNEQPIIALSNEPVNILTTPKTILYLCGRGGSKTYYNSLARIKGFQQLGFSVLAIDYRGYGLSEGRLTNESRLYEDSQAAWQYLVDRQQIFPQDIIIYGESLGGAIAIDLAVKQKNAAGLIVQSSFTNMIEQIKQFRPSLRIFPLSLILNQRFDSLEKVRSLSIPVLFLHGTNDTIVDYKMSRQLYFAAPEPKTLFYIPDAGHFRLYKPGKYSYLRAIQNFVEPSVDSLSMKD
ncbi:alpha/beta hydrolase [Waterburya agarophytonicola]|uniref:alpha/beta hydrolase n=1 Tax=Waterburya agarophytonicola TaxID=2886916 RepID=UPI001E48D28E|nr:alpha/beta fold hydrolase [Waterburya agarophytonicola]